MNLNRPVTINLPPLSDAEACHFVDAVYDIFLVVDSHYAQQTQRYLQQRKKTIDHPPADPCQGNNQSPDWDDPLPF